MIEVQAMRVLIAEYVLEQASWRQAQAWEYPGDPRYRQCAAGLEELAAYFLGLPAADERLNELARVCHDELEVGVFAPRPGGRIHQLISRFRFYNATQSPTLIARRLVSASIADKLEMGYVTGLLAEGG